MNHIFVHEYHLSQWNYFPNYSKRYSWILHTYIYPFHYTLYELYTFKLFHASISKHMCIAYCRSVHCLGQLSTQLTHLWRIDNIFIVVTEIFKLRWAHLAEKCGLIFACALALYQTSAAVVLSIPEHVYSIEPYVSYLV